MHTTCGSWVWQDEWTLIEEAGKSCRSDATAAKLGVAIRGWDTRSQPQSIKDHVTTLRDQADATRTELKLPDGTDVVVAMADGMTPLHGAALGKTRQQLRGFWCRKARMYFYEMLREGPRLI